MSQKGCWRIRIDERFSSENCSKNRGKRMNKLLIRKFLGSTVAAELRVLRQLECRYYDQAVRRKNQNKCYRARVVTLIIVFRNIYEIFRPILLLQYLLITNQYVASNYCLINNVIF